MVQSLRERILAFIRTNGQARVFDLARALAPISRVALHRQLKKMVESGILKKNGRPPLVFYLLNEKRLITKMLTISKEAEKVINQHYLYITPGGELLYGFSGFLHWLENIHQTEKIANLADSYVKILKEYGKFRKKEGWVDATFKLSGTFTTNYLTKLLYADFYSLPQFGKTALGALVLYAKQSQNRELMTKVCGKTKPLIEKIIKRFKIEAVAFIPPSIPRQIQFMSEFSAGLNLSLPQVNLVKTRTGQVIVAQKTLEKLAERVANARDSIFVKDKSVFKNILLIDDAVGSGASMNEVAKKIKETSVAFEQRKVKVYGFAVVGSFKGFEVIREI